MFIQNADLDLPKDQDSKIWRYMDFSKFCSMMLNNSLWFSRLDCYKDPFEGYWPYYMVQDSLDLINSKNKSTERELTTKEFIKAVESTKRRMVACCFHINPFESEAMWNLYVKNGEGIAIQTTVNRLIDCFKDAEGFQYIGKTRYLDFKDKDIKEPRLSDYQAALIKRSSFEHEKELRVLIKNPNGLDKFDFEQVEREKDTFSAINEYNEFIPSQLGVNIKINLKILIENIYISPTSQDWFKDLVNDFIQEICKNNKDCGNFQIIKSDLYEKPQY